MSKPEEDEFRLIRARRELCKKMQSAGATEEEILNAMKKIKASDLLPLEKEKTNWWYDVLPCAVVQRIRTYSAFNDWQSRHLMIQEAFEAGIKVEKNEVH